jgi:hypothetical protein
MSTENSESVAPQKSIEHQHVPQEHQGLHDFLYSAEDEHGVTVAAPIAIVTDAPVAVTIWCDAVQNAKVAGVYTVLDQQQQPQYIGYSRNVALSLRSHLTTHGAETCALVRVEPFKFPKREEMEQLRDRWLAALPTTPPGNAMNGEWAGTVRDAAVQVMSETEKALYEEKKLKLRRAMADGSLPKDILPARSDQATQLQEDNWSAVISEQTQETHS